MMCRSFTVSEIATKYGGSAMDGKPCEALDVDHSYMALGALMNAVDAYVYKFTASPDSLTNCCSTVLGVSWTLRKS